MTTLVNPQFNLISDPNLAFLADALCPQKVEILFKIRFPHLIKDSVISTIKVIRYKPQKRCLIEYTFAGSETITILGKIRFKGIDTHSYNLQKSLWENGFDDRSFDQISVPEPLGIIPQWKMWLQRKVQGVISTDLLSKPGGTQIARKVAQAAYKLHQFNPTLNRYHTIDDELKILHKKLPFVIELYPHWQTQINQILNQCNGLGKRLSNTPSVGIHRDFYPDQIILDNSRLYLLDFDLYCYGDRSLDIGNFIAHMTEYSLRMFDDFQGLKNQEIALREEYIKLTGEDTRERIMSYEILTLVRHLYLSTQFRDRQAYTEPLMRLCDQKFQEMKL